MGRAEQETKVLFQSRNACAAYNERWNKLRLHIVARRFVETCAQCCPLTNFGISKEWLPDLDTWTTTNFASCI